MVNFREIFSIKGGNEAQKVVENDKDQERQQRADAWAKKQRKRSKEIKKEFSNVSDDDLIKLYEEKSANCGKEMSKEAEIIKNSPESEMHIKLSKEGSSKIIKEMMRINNELKRRCIDLSPIEKEKEDRKKKVELSKIAREIKNKLLENSFSGNKPTLLYMEEKSLKKELKEIKEKLEKIYGLEELIITKILYGNEDIETLLGYEKE